LPAAIPLLAANRRARAQDRAALIEGNGGLVYNSYFDVARRYLLTSHDSTIHPGWGNRAA